MLGFALLCLATESEAEVAKSEAAESGGGVKGKHVAAANEATCPLIRSENI